MSIVGMDVGKATLSVAWIQGDQEETWGTVPNTPTGWEALATQVAARITTDETVVLVLEPTGGYELPVALWAHAHGWRVVRPNPYQVQQWIHSQGRRAKTDRQDARMLARYGQQPDLPTWQPLPEEVAELEQLVQWRASLQQHLAQAHTRQQQIVAHPQQHRAVIEGVHHLIEQLEADVAAVEQAIAEHLAQHTRLQEAQTLLRTVPGIGAKNVLPVLVTVLRWDTMTNGQGSSKGLVALVGLDPTPHESGTSVWQRPHISRQGDPEVRRLLYMGALGALRSAEGAVRQLYDRLVARGKAKRLALVAAARKILTWAWGVWHSGRPFDPAKAGVVA